MRVVIEGMGGQPLVYQALLIMSFNLLQGVDYLRCVKGDIFHDKVEVIRVLLTRS